MTESDDTSPGGNTDHVDMVPTSESFICRGPRTSITFRTLTVDKSRKKIRKLELAK